MIYRYNPEKHQALWLAVCDYLRKAGLTVTPDVVPEMVNRGTAYGYEFYSANGASFTVHAHESDGEWRFGVVRVEVKDEEEV